MATSPASQTSAVQGVVSAFTPSNAAQAAAVQQVVSAFTPSGGVAQTSDSARAEVGALGNDIRRYAMPDADTARLRQLAEQEMSLIAQRREDLEKRRIDEIEGIGQEFDELQLITEETQEKEFAGRATGLITQAGGALGLTQSHEGVLQNLTVTHRREIQSLVAKKQSAIRQAQNAYDERDFQLAREYLQVARETENQIFQREQGFFNQQLQLSQEMRAQTTFERDAAKETIDMLVQTNVTPSDRDIENLSQALKITPQMTREFINSARAAATAEAGEKQMESLKKIADVMRALPAGTEFSLPDGTVVTATGNSGDWSITSVNDDSGFVRQVWSNKLTGEQKTVSVGQIGKASGGSSSGASGWKFTQAQTGSLLAQNLTAKDINDMENVIKNQGIQTVIDQFVGLSEYINMTPEKQATYRKQNNLPEDFIPPYYTKEVVNNVIKILEAPLKKDYYVEDASWPDIIYGKQDE